MISFFGGLTLFSLLASWLSGVIFDAAVRDVTAQTTAVRNGIIVSTWTAVTTGLGRKKFRKAVHGLHSKSSGVKDKIDELTKEDRR